MEKLSPVFPSNIWISATSSGSITFRKTLGDANQNTATNTITNIVHPTADHFFFTLPASLIIPVPLLLPGYVCNMPFFFIYINVHRM